MSAARTVKLPAVERIADRNYYLTTTDNFGTSIRREFNKSRFGVIVWTERSSGNVNGSVTLCIDRGPFSYQDALTTAEARELAAALLRAADDSDALCGEQITEIAGAVS